MGFTKPDLPEVVPEEYLALPLQERLAISTHRWVDYGFGTAKIFFLIYAIKLVFFYALPGIIITTATSGLHFWEVDTWWDQPIIYQKLIIWTMFLESLNLAGAWGPLTNKFKPWTGGFRFWSRTGTIRLRPWTWVPGTAGTTRTPLDVGMYFLFLISLVVALVAPGGELEDSAPHRLIDPKLLIAPLVLICLIGFRDKVVFLASRAEQYVPALLIFAILPYASFATMIVAGKLLIVVVWVGAGLSKVGLHFVNVIPVMVSNSPMLPWKSLRRANYRNYPNDLRPSKLARFMADILGAIGEIAVPILLLFSVNRTLTVVGVVFMICYHLFIISTFPLAVPLEWNLLFIYISIILFVGFPAGDGYSVVDMNPPWLILVIFAMLIFFPVLGNIRPDKVSFLPSLRQYAGNWAVGLWAFAPGAEDKLNRLTKRPIPPLIDQLEAIDVPREWGEVIGDFGLSWRAMHSQGRGVYSTMMRFVQDIDLRRIREGEVMSGICTGFNFGDGHLHDENMIAAVQEQVRFDPGDVMIVWAESQPITRFEQDFKIIDPAVGVLAKGTWSVRDCVNALPWLPDGPIPLNITWTSDPKRFPLGVS